MFYTGNPKQERCSVVLRVAPTFVRFGSFEIFKPTDSTTGVHDMSPHLQLTFVRLVLSHHGAMVQLRPCMCFCTIV